MRLLRKITLLLLPLLISPIGEAVSSCDGFQYAGYQAAVCTESAEELHNPYIGWYRIYAYTLSDSVFDPAETVSQEQGAELVLLEISLREYRESPISDAGLQQLDAILGAWQSAGKQLILRFLYDWDGNGQESEPSSLDLILEHMSQTAAVVNLHSDCIYIIQGIFVGSWGEMHGSNHMNDENMLTLIRHLDSVVDPAVFFAVRTPRQWRTIIGSPEAAAAAKAFDGSLCARLGLYNDGMLGSHTDLGTYGEEGAAEPAAYTEAHSRQEEILFQADLCSHVPNGGEVVNDNPCNDFAAAQADLRATHVSYLNQAYDQAVFSKWAASTWSGEGPFNGMNGLDYIARHLGYRYVLRSSEHRIAKMPDGGSMDLLVLSLENTGFSTCYRPLEVTLILQDAEGGAAYSLPVDTDPRLWQPGTDITLEIPLEVQEYTPGTYSVCLKLTDPASGYEILLANENEHGENGYTAGILTIADFSQEHTVPGAPVGKAYRPSVPLSFERQKQPPDGPFQIRKVRIEP